MVKEIKKTKHIVIKVFHQKFAENTPYWLSIFVNLWSSLVNKGTWESKASDFCKGYCTSYFLDFFQIEALNSSSAMFGIVYDKLIPWKFVTFGRFSHLVLVRVRNRSLLAHWPWLACAWFSIMYCPTLFVKVFAKERSFSSFTSINAKSCINYWDFVFVL